MPEPWLNAVGVTDANLWSFLKPSPTTARAPPPPSPLRLRLAPTTHDPLITQGHSHADMANDASSSHHHDRPSLNVSDLLAYTKTELDADAERQAQLQAVNPGEIPRDTQTGVTLDLCNKGISALPKELILLIKDRVERLALSHNPQISIPLQINQCHRLRYLNIRKNALSSFPEAVLLLSGLEILDVSKNRLTGIPEDIKKMTSLKFLAVEKNSIRRLPLALGDMSRLSKLRFEGNPIEYPPPEILRTSQDLSSSLEFGEERDVCASVKRFLKAASLRQRIIASTDEEASESNVETPRPPKRSVTGGRFPIKPSLSGIENIPDGKSDSPEQHMQPPPAPPIPQRSHARMASTNASLLTRPGVAPLVVAGNDISRSRSETASTSASVRQRRQGFVPSRRPTVEVRNTNDRDEATIRSSQASTIKATHSRATSSVSTFNGFLTASGGETSSEATSPVDGSYSRHGSVRRLSRLPESRKPKAPAHVMVRSARQLLFIFGELYRPIHRTALAMKDSTPRKTALERQLFSANAQVEELDRLLNRLTGGVDVHDQSSLRTIGLASMTALRSYGTVVAELKRQIARLVKMADGVYIRNLMFQVYNAMVEAKNICALLGFKPEQSPEAQKTTRPSQAWNSRTVTPTQPRPNTSRRMRGATILQSMATNSGIRSIAPPVIPTSTSSSRTNTMNSSFNALTPNSATSFSTLATSHPTLSRSNTMRSATDDTDSDEQFDRIFLKLKPACELAAQALPHCRAEFQARIESAQGVGTTRVSHTWRLALGKCDDAIQKNKSLRRTLESIKVNDPAVRHSKEFWQLCDAFVQSWTELATEVKDIGSQRIDITTIKALMRNVQRAVKDVSKAISHSPLYHQALGRRNPDSAGLHSLAPPFPAGLGPTGFPPASGVQSGYVALVPATPLSAALGPAVQATVASTPSETHTMAQYFPESHQTVRATHERNDTVMQTMRPRRTQGT